MYVLHVQCCNTFRFLLFKQRFLLYFAETITNKEKGFIDVFIYNDRSIKSINIYCYFNVLS